MALQTKHIFVGWHPEVFGFDEMEPFPLSYHIYIGGSQNGNWGTYYYSPLLGQWSIDGQAWHIVEVELDHGTAWGVLCQPIGGIDSNNGNWTASQFQLNNYAGETMEICYIDDWGYQAQV